MTKTKKASEQSIITAYMNYVLEYGDAPKSVSSFAKASGFKKAKFYDYFNDFAGVEKQVFTVFYLHTMNLLKNNEEYNLFDARNKLLSFYFTFFEVLTANRTYVIARLSKQKYSLKCLEPLSKLETHFKRYIEQLGIETLDLKNQKIQNIQDKSMQYAAWIQLLLTIKFWMDDTSPSFEKTDIFIEKSIHATFDLINTQPLKSVIDLGKFLIKEKTPFGNQK